MAETLGERPAPTDCEHEPPFPGMDTVVVSFRYPDLTCHLPRPDCGIKEPHRIDECGAFTGAE